MSGPLILYGIPNCDTVKKACRWLTDHNIAHRLHDYKKAGVARDQLITWCERAGWEAVINRAGTTFRKLPEADKAGLDQDKAVALMIAQPSMIKRPIIDHGDQLLIGFKPELYEAAFADAAGQGSA